MSATPPLPFIISGLSKNQKVFQSLLSGLSKEAYLWKPQPEKWCLLEIVCHLYDEEREDFRTRVKLTLEDPAQPMPSFNPTAWVSERKYSEQDYEAKVADWLKERTRSIEWLSSLQSPKWSNSFQHPILGELSASLFLANWLAHDYLHIRQIMGLKHGYLAALSGESLTYAGNW